MARRRLSIEQARRIALAAQGFADPRPSGRVDRRHIRRLFDRVGLLQVDSVNVLVRSEELPVFARLGSHPRDLVRAMERDGELFEYWGHEASLLPVEIEPLLRHRMESFDDGPWQTVAALKRSNPGLIEAVYDEVADRGPIRAGDLTGAVRKTDKWWGWSDHKRALEYLFAIGRLSAVRASNNFERLYDLRERVLPPAVVATPTPTADDARTELLLRSARHHGIGTARSLCDYYRINISTARPLLRHLVEDGSLNEVEVVGWDETAYLHPDAKIPRSVHTRALISPFDPIVWERNRAEHLWDFHYRIEIYTPEPKRTYGYYVLPFLLDEALVARVDLKADRKAKVLRVHGAFAERHAEPRPTAVQLAAELSSMARWLELDRVEVGDRGDLATELQRAVADPGTTDLER